MSEVAKKWQAIQNEEQQTLMAGQIQIEEDIAICKEKLEQCASNSTGIHLHFLEKQDKSYELLFEIKRRDSHFKALTPILHGRLSPQQDSTLIKGEFYPSEFGLGFLSLWCLGITFLAGLALAARFVISLRANALGYVSSPLELPLVLIGLPLFGLALMWLAWRTQQDDQQYVIKWIALCFNRPLQEVKAANSTNKERSLNIARLFKAILGVGGLGIAFGIFFGMASDIQDNLPPLKITVTDVQICAIPNANTEPTPQSVFSTNQDVYVCGHLTIEKVDQRDIQIPLSFTWYYGLDGEEAGAVEYEFESDGFFTALLDRPASGIYRPGKYSVSITRVKTQLAVLYFEIIAPE